MMGYGGMVCMMEKIGEDIHLFLGRKLPNASGPANMARVTTIELVRIWTIVFTCFSRMFIV